MQKSSFQSINLIYTFNDPVTDDPYEKVLGYFLGEHEKSLDKNKALIFYQKNLWIVEIDQEKIGKFTPLFKAFDLYNHTVQNNRGRQESIYNDTTITSDAREFFNIPKDYRNRITRIHVASYSR